MANQSQQDIIAVNNAIIDVTTNVGFFERAKLKLKKTITSMPIIKQSLQFQNFAKNIGLVHQATQKNNKTQQDGNKTQQQQVPLLTMAVGLMTQYGAAAQLGAKGTSGLSKALFSLGGTILFMVGIFLTIALAVGVFVVALADAQSPLAEWLNSIPIVSDVLNGLRIILTGEDGESGLAGAFDVLGVALIAGGAAFLLFGAPVGVAVATIVAVVGIYRYVKAQTDSFVAGLLAAGTVLMAGLTVFLGLFAGFGSTLVSFVMLPLTLILAGVTGVWLSLTGEISYWWGVISAIGIVIGLALLKAGSFVAFVTMLPVVAVVAAGAALIFTIVYYWDEIVALLMIAWGWIETFGGWIWGGITTAWGWIEGAFTALGDLFSSVIGFYVAIFVGAWTGIVGAWNIVLGFLTNVKDSIFGFFGMIGDWIYGRLMAGRDAIVNLGSMFKDAALGAVRAIMNPWINLWNDKVAGIIPKKKIPKWIPKVGGKSFGPFPDRLKPFAEGGLVSSPTRALVGEAGPEAIIPLRSGNVPVKITGRQSDGDIAKAINDLSKQIAMGGNTINMNLDLSGVVVPNDRALDDLINTISDTLKERLEASMKSFISDSGNRSWYA